MTASGWAQYTKKKVIAVTPEMAQDLTDLSKVEGRSEADLVREAVALLIRRKRRQRV